MPTTPTGLIVPPDRPRVGRFVDFVDLADTGTGTALDRNLEPVFAGQCLAYACEHTVHVRQARHVDFVGTVPGGKPGVPPTVVPRGTTPVYAVPPPECCEGDDERIASACAPVHGMPRELLLFLGYPVGFANCDPECGAILLRYNDGGGGTGTFDTGTGTGTFGVGAWEGGPASFRGGDMYFRLWCDDRGAGPEWRLDGFGCGTFTAWTGTVCLNDAIFMNIGAQAIGSGCCDWPLQTEEISGTIIGTCGFIRAARFVDMVGTSPAYGFTKCCNNMGDTAAPDCCDRLPKNIVVEVTSSCSTFDGVTFNLVAGDSGASDVWYDEQSKDGTVITCALSCSPFSQGNAAVSPCSIPSSAVYCDPQGYVECGRRSYLAGAIHINVTCTGVANPGLFGGASACEICDCNGDGEPLDLTVSGTIQCTDSGGPCCCTFAGEIFTVSFRVTQ